MSGSIVLNPVRSINNSDGAASGAGFDDFASPSASTPGRPGMERAPSKTKSTLVLAAERYDRRTAVISGYLRKRNSENRWQKRYFEIVGNYWVYYKTDTSQDMLCAMDLWKASRPELVAPAGTEDEGAQCEFCITWDRYRVFRAVSPADAVRWVNAIQQVQALRPPELSDRSMLGPPTPALAGHAKTAETGTATETSRDWIEKDRRRSDAAQGGGVCGSCVIS